MTRSQAGTAVLEGRGERPAWSSFPASRHLEVASWGTQTRENRNEASERNAGKPLPSVGGGGKTTGDTVVGDCFFVLTGCCGPRHTDHSRRPESESQENKHWEVGGGMNFNLMG